MPPTISPFSAASTSAFYTSTDSRQGAHHGDTDDTTEARRHSSGDGRRVRTATQVGRDPHVPYPPRSSAEVRHDHDMNARQAARIETHRRSVEMRRSKDIRDADDDGGAARDSRDGSRNSTDKMSDGSDRGVTLDQLADAANNGGLRTRSRAELEMFRRVAAGNAREPVGQAHTRVNSAPGCMLDPPSRASSAASPIEIIIHNEAPSRAGSRDTRRTSRQGSGMVPPPNSSEGTATTDDAYMVRRLRRRRSLWGHGPEIDYEGRAYATTKGILKGIAYLVAGGGGLAGIGLVAHNTVGVTSNSQGISNIVQNLTDMAPPPMP